MYVSFIKLIIIIFSNIVPHWGLARGYMSAFDFLNKLMKDIFISFFSDRPQEDVNGYDSWVMSTSPICN